MGGGSSQNSQGVFFSTKRDKEEITKDTLSREKIIVDNKGLSNTENIL